MAAVITESEKISFHLSKERLVVMMVRFSAGPQGEMGKE